MHVAKLDIDGTSLVGLHVVALETVVFVAPSTSEKQRELIAEVFQAEVVELTIAGTGLLGVFCATNGEELLVPSIIFDHEEEILKNSGITYHVIETTQTCLGNTLVVTKKGALIAPGFSDEVKRALTEVLGVPLKEAMLHEATTIGSYMVCTQTHGLASYEFSDDQLDDFEKFLGVKLSTGTVNLGATQIRSGLVATTKGFIIGTQSGGPEVVHADEAFGFLGDDG